MSGRLKEGEGWWENQILKKELKDTKIQLKDIKIINQTVNQELKDIKKIQLNGIETIQFAEKEVSQNLLQEKFPEEFEKIDEIKEVENRFEFLCDYQKVDSIKITFFNGTEFKTIKSFFYEESEEKDLSIKKHVKLYKPVSFVPKEKFYRLVFGNKNIDQALKNGKDIVQMYALFDVLQMKKHKYLILQKVKEIEDYKILLELLYFSKKEFQEKFPSDDTIKTDNFFLNMIYDKKEEEEEKEEKNKVGINFNSLLTQCIFNVFKSKYNDIHNLENDSKEKKKVRKFLMELKLTDVLDNYEIKPIENHPDFLMDVTQMKKENEEGFIKLKSFVQGKVSLIPKEKTFLELFQNHLKVLFRDRDSYFNLKIITSKDGKITKAHKEILMLKSDYFFKVLKFEGNEVKENTLTLSKINNKELEMMLKYIYLGEVKIPNYDLYSAVSLLSEISSYADKEFEKNLVSKILEVSEVMIEGKNNIFLNEFEKFCHFFHEQSPVKLKMVHQCKFLQTWMKKILKKKLVVRIRNSISKILIEEKEKENIFLKKKIKELEKENEKENILLKKRIKELEKENEMLKQKKE